MDSFDFRGLEFHSSRMWQLSHVERALRFMEQYGLNALIFHQNDLVDQLVFPSAYFNDTIMWEISPVRMHTVYNNRHYINKVIRDAKEKGIHFYLEVKELNFADELFDVVEGLRDEKGVVCPRNIFWYEFISTKYEELLNICPDLEGIIVSLGTRESKISVSANKCECEACKGASSGDWYLNILEAMYRPLSQKGKKLILRDFSYTADHQSMMIEAAAKCSKDIIISLKNTPHDFYPTFPDNPKIGYTGQHKSYVEFDTWGQFFGMGFFPVSIAEDLQRRLRRCLEKDVAGVWFRTDWEVMYELSVFNSPNMVNLYAGAMLSKDVNTDLDVIYKTWVDSGIISPLKSGSYEPYSIHVPPGQWIRWKELMIQSWSIMEKTSYVRGHLFFEDDQTPDTIQKAFDMMVRIHGRDEYEPGASKRLIPSDKNLAVIFKEKEAALTELKELIEILDLKALGLSLQDEKEFAEILELYTYYVDASRVSTYAVFKTEYAKETKKREHILEAKKTINTLEDRAKKMKERLDKTHYPHYVYWLLDYNRLLLLAKDVEEIAAALWNTIASGNNE